MFKGRYGSLAAGVWSASQMQHLMQQQLYCCIYTILYWYIYTVCSCSEAQILYTFANFSRRTVHQRPRALFICSCSLAFSDSRAHRSVRTGRSTFKGSFSPLAADALCSIADVAPHVLAQGGHARCFSRRLFFRQFSTAHFCSVLDAGDLASALLVCDILSILYLFRWAGATRSSCLSRFRAGLFFALFMRLLLIIWTAMIRALVLRLR